MTRKPTRKPTRNGPPHVALERMPWVHLAYRFEGTELVMFQPGQVSVRPLSQHVTLLDLYLSRLFASLRCFGFDRVHIFHYLSLVCSFGLFFFCKAVWEKNSTKSHLLLRVWKLQELSGTSLADRENNSERCRTSAEVRSFRCFCHNECRMMSH